MKSIILIGLSLIHLTLCAQNVQSIRFVYSGEELKPHGTLLISKVKQVRPSDRIFDSTFGRGIKTDEGTFKSIDSFIRRNKYTTIDRKKIPDSIAVYSIIEPTGTKHFLAERNFEPFFNDLTRCLKEKSLDSDVINALKKYYSNWRN